MAVTCFLWRVGLLVTSAAIARSEVGVQQSTGKGWLSIARSLSKTTEGARARTLPKPPSNVANTYVSNPKDLVLASLSDEALFNAAPYARLEASSAVCDTQRAVDGLKHGYVGDCTTSFETRAEKEPWLTLDLGEVMAVFSVEVWSPIAACAVIGAKVPCSKRDRPGDFTNLRVELFKGTDNTMVLHTQTFTDASDVRTLQAPSQWRPFRARSIRLSVPAISQARAQKLAVAEIRVIVAEASEANLTSHNQRCETTPCPFGLCRGSSCSCMRDHLGSDCTHRVLVDRGYLPSDAELLKQRNRGAFPVTALRKFEKDFAALQACTSPESSYPYLPGPKGMGAGLGSTLFFMTGDMSDAMKAGRRYEFTGRLNYAANEWCAARGAFQRFECYFEPLSSCNDTSANSWVEPPPAPLSTKERIYHAAKSMLQRGQKEDDAIKIAKMRISREIAKENVIKQRQRAAALSSSTQQSSTSENTDQPRYIDIESTIGRRQPRERRYRKITSSVHTRRGLLAATLTKLPVPKRAECTLRERCQDMSRNLINPMGHANHGLFLLRAMQMARLFRINADTAREMDLEHVKQKIGFTHPIIGVHVRRGDSCHTTLRKGHCKQLSDYLPYIRMMSKRYDTTRVFLATDDAQIISQTQAASDLKWVIRSIEENRTQMFQSDSKIETRLSKNAVDAHSLTLSTLTDIELLARSDAMVVHLASCMSRMALLIGSHRRGYLIPYYSMDGPFCPHWRMCCSVTMNGRSEVC